MDYYSIIAPSYNELHGEEQIKKINYILNYLLKEETIAKKLINKELTLLDVGAGTGIYFPILKKYFKKITGLEPSPGLIKESKEKNIIKGRAEEIPFKEKSFDIITSITAIQNFNNIKKGIEEIKRVGKKYYVLTFLKKSPKKEKIINIIKETFKEEKIIIKGEEKDLIFFINIE